MFARTKRSCPGLRAQPASTMRPRVGAHAFVEGGDAGFGVFQRSWPVLSASMVACGAGRCARLRFCQMYAFARRARGGVPGIAACAACFGAARSWKRKIVRNLQLAVLSLAFSCSEGGVSGGNGPRTPRFDPCEEESGPEKDRQLQKTCIFSREPDAAALPGAIGPCRLAKTRLRRPWSAAARPARCLLFREYNGVWNDFRKTRIRAVRRRYVQNDRNAPGRPCGARGQKRGESCVEQLSRLGRRARGGGRGQARRSMNTAWARARAATSWAIFPCTRNLSANLPHSRGSKPRWCSRRATRPTWA